MPRAKGSSAPRRSPTNGAKPGPKPGPRVEQFRFSLAVSDANALRAATGLDDLADVLRRIAASYAADASGTRIALAPLVAVQAWDGEEIL